MQVSCLLPRWYLASCSCCPESDAASRGEYLPQKSFWRSDVLHLGCRHHKVILAKLKVTPWTCFFGPPFGYALPRFQAVTCWVGIFCKVSLVKHSSAHTHTHNYSCMHAQAEHAFSSMVVFHQLKIQENVLLGKLC